MKQYIIAHDLGTSGDKASLVRLDGVICRNTTYAYPMEHPHTGWAEQDPNLWWDAFCKGNRELLNGVQPEEIAGICLTGQMMACLPVDDTGEALHPAIIWADGRAEEQACALKERIGAWEFYQTVGMRISANYGLPKMVWLKENKPEIYEKTHRFLSPKDYINGKLTGRFVIDPENAAFLHCTDLKSGTWSAQLLQEAGISVDKMPEILPLSTVIGGVTSNAAAACGLTEGTPVIMGPGDGGAATLGAAVLEPGEAYASVGTSSWICVVSGRPDLDCEQRVAKIKYLDTMRDSGTMQTGGFAHRWMENLLCQPEQLRAQQEGRSIHQLVEEYAKTSQPGSGGVLFHPYLMGERAPIWDMQMRGAFLGITAQTTRADLCRGVLEGVALHLHWIYRCILSANHMQGVTSMKMVGGGAQSALWSQIFADVFGIPIEITGKPDQAGALGTAVIAGVGLGLYADYNVIREFQPVIRTVQPNPALRDLYGRLSRIMERTATAIEPFYHEWNY